MTFPQNSFFGNVLPYHDDFLPKTKMVRVVHMNIFYRMDLEICDSKSEFWTKTEKNREVEKLKNQFWDPKWTFEAVSKTKMTFKNILESSAIIPAQFPYIKYLF